MTVHTTAVVDEGAVIGDGTKIWHFCHVSRGARLGRDCVLGQNVYVGDNVVIGDGVRVQNNVSIYDGVTIEDYVFCGPSMVFTNVRNPRSAFPRRRNAGFDRTLIQRGATLGANCTIVCGTTVGSWSLVAAGAVVTHDVPDFALVAGVPGRVVGHVCACGLRLPDDLACPCGRHYEMVGASGGSLRLTQGELP